MVIKSTSKKGFTLIETVSVLAILAIMGSAIAPMVVRAVDRKRETVTIEALKEFKDAITGKQELINGDVRTHFGYIGDMGSMPTKIEDLYQLGTQSSFAYDGTTRTGAGWNGPYIDTSLVEDLSSLKEDAYGREYTYSATEFEDLTVGTTVSAKIVSKGKDGISGSVDDLSVYIHKSRVFSRVVGVVVGESGSVVPAVTVKMNYPSGGTLVMLVDTTDTDGRYEFTDIPYGNRSITVEPKLVYGIDSAVISGSQNADVVLRITNFSKDDISITSFKAVYTVTPDAYYGVLVIDGNTVSTSPRRASGYTVSFSSITIPGSGATTNGITFPIRVQSPLTQVDDLNVASGTSRGGTISISMETFKDALSGGSTVDMTGVTFEVTFSDGSKILFTTM